MRFGDSPARAFSAATRTALGKSFMATCSAPARVTDTPVATITARQKAPIRASTKLFFMTLPSDGAGVRLLSIVNRHFQE